MTDMDPATERMWVESYNAWIDRMALEEDRTIQWGDGELIDTDAGRGAFQAIRFRPRGSAQIGVLCFRWSRWFCPRVWIDPVGLFGYWTGTASHDLVPVSIDPLNVEACGWLMDMAA